MADRDDHGGESDERRARLALARALADDEAEIRAIMSAYVAHELSEHLPEFLQWLLEHLDLEAIAADWVLAGRNATLPDPETGGVHVFLCPEPRLRPRT